MGVFPEIAASANHDLRPSTQFATISPGTASCARSASRARSSRFGSLTCGTSRRQAPSLRRAHDLANAV